MGIVHHHHHHHHQITTTNPPPTSSSPQPFLRVLPNAPASALAVVIRPHQAVELLHRRLGPVGVQAAPRAVARYEELEAWGRKKWQALLFFITQKLGFKLIQGAKMRIERVSAVLYQHRLSSFSDPNSSNTHPTLTKQLSGALEGSTTWNL